MADASPRGQRGVESPFPTGKEGLRAGRCLLRPGHLPEVQRRECRVVLVREAGTAAPNFELMLSPQVGCGDGVVAAFSLQAYSPADAEPASPWLVASQSVNDLSGTWTAYPPLPDDIGPTVDAVWDGNRLLLVGRRNGVALDPEGTQLDQS